MKEEKNKVLVEALKIVRDDMVDKMNEGIEDAEPHVFSYEFERNMEKILKMNAANPKKERIWLRRLVFVFGSVITILFF